MIGPLLNEKGFMFFQIHSSHRTGWRILSGKAIEKAGLFFRLNPSLSIKRGCKRHLRNTMQYGQPKGLHNQL